MGTTGFFELSIGSTPLRTVVIRHDLPDGTSHFDWMLARDANPEIALITFRMYQRVDKLSEAASATAIRLADHRTAYLDYEGPVSANRGRVMRIRSGRTICSCRATEPRERWQVMVSWDGKDGSADPETQRLTIAQENDDVWRVFCVTMPLSCGIEK